MMGQMWMLPWLFLIAEGRVSVPAALELSRMETVETDAAAGPIVIDPFRDTLAVDEIVRIAVAFPCRHLEFKTCHRAFLSGR